MAPIQGKAQDEPVTPEEQMRAVEGAAMMLGGLLTPESVEAAKAKVRERMAAQSPNGTGN